MNKSGLYQNNSTSASNIEMAKSLARKVFELYDKDKSTGIENYELPDMMQDTYEIVNLQFQPTQRDLDGYFNILDKNGDGKITLADVEALCIKYFCGGELSQQSQKPEKVKKAGVQVRAKSIQPKFNVTSPIAAKAIEQAKVFFKNYDADNLNSIRQNDIPSLLEDTYLAIGENKTFTWEDIENYLKIFDIKNDSRISFDQYIGIFLKTLESFGFDF